MTGENLSVGSVYDNIDQITQLEVASQKQQRIPTFNTAMVIATLPSSTLISTMKKPLNKDNSNTMLMFLFSVIGLSLFSLSMSATMANAQTSSNSTLSTNSTSNETGVKQMGICIVGVKSPCNGDINSPK
jgi:hypothetical protein